jgi:hypothetical protein
VTVFHSSQKVLTRRDITDIKKKPTIKKKGVETVPQSAAAVLRLRLRLEVKSQVIQKIPKSQKKLEKIQSWI